MRLRSKIENEKRPRAKLLFAEKRKSLELPRGNLPNVGQLRKPLVEKKKNIKRNIITSVKIIIT